jgi:uncharacterized protein YndB with AHSA1/START domain
VDELRFEIERLIPASAAELYDAWTDPARLSDWFAPNEGMPTEATIDLRIGGGYRLELGGATVSGSYIEIVPGERLAFTWSWAHEPELPDMLVTVDFLPAHGGTLLRVVHERFASAEDRDNHGWSWEQNLGRLAKLVAAK